MGKYFKNIKNLEDLKNQYKKLLKANHPDNGGDVEAMKEINCEYDALFPIWKNRHNAEQPQNQIYAAHFLKNYIMALPGAQLFTLIDSSHLITKTSYNQMWKSIISKMNEAISAPKGFPLITGLTAHIFRHNDCTELCYQIPKISI